MGQILCLKSEAVCEKMEDNVGHGEGAGHQNFCLLSPYSTILGFNRQKKRKAFKNIVRRGENAGSTDRNYHSSNFH